MKLCCFSCNFEIPLLGTVGRREECPKCKADVHVCKNCEFYDVKVYNECKEPQADVVKERDRANFCDYFQPSGRGPSAGDKKDELLSAAEALFKKN